MMASRKGLRFVGIIAFMVVLFCLTASFASDNGPMALDLVIVSDQSNSMYNDGKGNDPEGYRLDAAAIMIGMCDMEYSNAGVVMFHNGVIAEDKYSDAKLNQIVRLDEAGRSIYQSMFVTGPKVADWREKRNGNYTDIESALVKALDMLEEQDKTGNHRVVLLLSDGQVDLGDASKSKASVGRIQSGILDRAKEMGVTIHTVYLSAKGTGDPTLLGEIADKTGGTYSAVQRAEDLPVAFNRIFAAQIGSDPQIVSAADAVSDTTRGDGYKKLPISVPNQSVKELNIVVPKPKQKGIKTGEILFWV